MGRVMMVGNANGLDGGVVADRLVAAGFEIVPMARERPDDWREPAGGDLLLLLGSEWHVYAPETRAEVDAEIELVRRTAARGVSILGICFGGQIISTAFGGTVSRVEDPEIGWFDVGIDPGIGVAGGPWMQWHSDVFTVPDGFRQLAANAVGPQLIAAPGVVGTQFHPEVTAEIIESWLADGGEQQLRDLGRDPDDLRGQIRDNIAISARQALGLVDWFLGHAGVGAGRTSPARSK